jgi:hypothetical protein
MTGGTAPISTAFAARPVPAKIPRHLAAAGRVPDMHRALQVQRRHQRRHVIGISVHLIAQRGLGRAPMPAPVMRDHAKALIQKKQHLRVPVIGA